MKRIINLILAIVLMCMTTLTVSATEYITDVMLIGGGSDSELNSLRSTYTAQGWTVINYDLNGGIPWGTRNVQGILLLYKTTSSTGSSGTPITDFYLQNKFASETSETLTHFGRTYTLVPNAGNTRFTGQKGDLNAGTGSETDAIHLFYTKETFADNRAVTAITFDSNPSGSLGKEGDLAGGYDLNAGCSAITSRQIYMHLTTAENPIPNCYFTDVMLIGEKTKAKVTELMETYTAQGWKVIGYDLNRGLSDGADWIYLLYKTAISPDGLNHGYITDFYLENKLASQTITPISYNGHEYHLVPYVGGDHFVGQQGDLNSGTGASTDAIHLFYTKEHFLSDGRAVNGITINDVQSGAVGKEGGSTGYDLNAGCNTDKHIYLHFSTASTHKNASPIASLKSFTFSLKGKYVYVIGWAFDPDEPYLASLIRAEVYSSDNKLYKTETFQTWVEYNDANNIYNITGAHGFGNYIRLDGAPADTYIVKLYAEDLTGDPDVQIGETQTVTITRTKPIAYLDKLDVLDEGIRVQGWAFDPDLPNEGVPIRVEVKRPGGSTYTEYTLEQTDVYRGDLNSHPDYAQYNLTGNHGFDITVPIGISYTYKISVYAEDITGEEDVQAGATETIDYTHIVRLTSTTEEVSVRNGDVLTGTGGPGTHVIIEDHSVVTFDGVDINYVPTDDNNTWGGVTCEGDTWIVLADGTTNKVTSRWNSGILASPPGYEVHIEGNGRLEATSLYEGSAIGSGGKKNCGKIVISGGTIVAKGAYGAAGIGSGRNVSCGNITIDGGDVTATGGAEAVAIGSGSGASCGDITITNGVTRVTATAGTSCPYSIGKGIESSCGTVTIGDFVVDGIRENPFVYEPGKTQFYTITYNLDGGVNISNPLYYLSQSSDITLADPVRFHYDFVGWTWEGQETPTKSVTIPHGSTGNRTFTALWKYNPVGNIDYAPSPYMAYDGDELTGTGNADTHITIADGATVTLSGVDITGITNDNRHKWAGISCLGDATIILTDGTINKTKGGHENYPGIFVPKDKTLTIKGAGSLEASSNGKGCGIGGGYQIDAGNIVIDGGNIKATGAGGNAAGIGGGYEASCGDITITQNIIYVFAVSKDYLVPIGGYLDRCGAINIADELIIEGIEHKNNMRIFHALGLEDKINNSEAINAKDGRFCSLVYLYEHTIYGDDKWNTLCLPFSMSKEQIAASHFLKDADIMELNTETTSLDNNKLTVNFKKTESITAGHPYIVRIKPYKPVYETPEDVMKFLDICDKLPTVTNGIDEVGDDYGTIESNLYHLVDGNTSTTFISKSGKLWIEFNYDEPIIPQGYVFWTGNNSGEDGEDDEAYSRNPTEWRIYGMNEGDVDWTMLVQSGEFDQLSYMSYRATVFPINNHKAYKYYRLEAYRKEGEELQVAEFQFFVAPNHEIHDVEDPLFMNVTINASAPTPVNFKYGKFTGSYSPFDSTTGQLSDKNNTNGGAFHASFDLSNPPIKGFKGWYWDPLLTNPVTTISFDKDGSVTLYADCEKVVSGDANGDGQVTIADAEAIVNYILGKPSADFNPEAANVNGDVDGEGKPVITIADAVAVLNIIMK